MAALPESAEVADGDKTESAFVQCKTSAGSFAMKFQREWAPNGYDRSVRLFERGFYDSTHFYRVVPNFLTQFGITYSNSNDLKKFAYSHIKDDPQFDPKIKFEEGIISFAGSGPDSRTSQLFIALAPSESLGTQSWETPVGKVVQGIESIRNLYSGYGDMPPWGKGPQQGLITNKGRRYIEEEYPLLDRFLHCSVKRISHEPGEEVEIPSNAAEGLGTSRGIRSGNVHRDLRPVEGDHVQDKRAILGGGVVLLIVVIILFFIPEQKTKSSKKN